MTERNDHYERRIIDLEEHYLSRIRALERVLREIETGLQSMKKPSTDRDGALVITMLAAIRGAFTDKSEGGK